MRERGRGLRGETDGAGLERGERPRPNRLSDEAKPNILTGAGAAPRNEAPSWVHAATAQRRVIASRAGSARPATGSADGSEAAQSSPSWFTIIIAGFILLSFLRACLGIG